MPNYVYLLEWTEKGIAQVKDSPARAAAADQEIVGAGGRILLQLHTMGPYDLVLAVELPSDEAANLLALRWGRQGFVRTTTLKGWPQEQFAELCKKV